MVTRKPLILCVDDEQRNLELLEAILVPRGYDVEFAKNGIEALELLLKHPVDLILLDVMMPELDGFEVCKRMKADERFRQIPVIMITSLSSKQERVKSIEAGAEEFLTKPFSEMEVLARIKMLLTVKGLNEELKTAYQNIVIINSYGKKTAQAFAPVEFNLVNNMNDIVDLLIRKRSDELDRPQYIILRMQDDDSNSEWYCYQYVFGNLDKSNLDMAFMSQEEVGISFGGREMIEAKFGVLAEKLERYNIFLDNIVCYQGEYISIIAANYGREVTRYDAAVLDTLVIQSLFFKSISDQIVKTNNAFEYTIHTLARASEVNDEDTGNHILRVGVFCGMIAKRIGMDDKFVQHIIRKAPLHDIGKIYVPHDILRKPWPLTVDEWTIMRKHTIYGSKIIGDHPEFVIARAIALNHHEKWDGSGYPNGIQGENIPIEARIMAVADIYDSLRSKRPYKQSLDHSTACKIIIEGDGRTSPKHFDPKVLQAFKDLAPKFEEVYAKMIG